MFSLLLIPARIDQRSAGSAWVVCAVDAAAVAQADEVRALVQQPAQQFRILAVLLLSLDPCLLGKAPCARLGGRRAARGHQASRAGPSASGVCWFARCSVGGVTFDVAAQTYDIELNVDAD